MSARVVTLMSAIALSACVSMRAPEQGASRSLVPPASLKMERSANQIVHGAFGAREMTMNCVVTVHGDVLTVIGLTAMGVRAFTLRYDGKQVAVENDLPVPPQLTPERLLADIQLVYWPLDALRSALQHDGWELTVPFSGTRRLRRGATLVAEVHYDNADPWRGRSWLANFQYGYTLAIDSKPVTP